MSQLMTAPNPMKRAKNIENCIYCPIVYNQSKMYGVIQIANSERPEIFDQEDCKIMKIICHHVAQFLHN